VSLLTFDFGRADMRLRYVDYAGDREWRSGNKILDANALHTLGDDPKFSILARLHQVLTRERRLRINARACLHRTAFLRRSAALLFLIDLTLDGPLLASRFFGASPEFGEVEGFRTDV
jgi:hypothetical protein